MVSKTKIYLKFLFNWDKSLHVFEDTCLANSPFTFWPFELYVANEKKILLYTGQLGKALYLSYEQKGLSCKKHHISIKWNYLEIDSCITKSHWFCLPIQTVKLVKEWNGLRRICKAGIFQYYINYTLPSLLLSLLQRNGIGPILYHISAIARRGFIHFSSVCWKVF